MAIIVEAILDGNIFKIIMMLLQSYYPQSFMRNGSNTIRCESRCGGRTASYSGQYSFSHSRYEFYSRTCDRDCFSLSQSKTK